MADRNLTRFIPPNLRQPLSELSGIGYQLLDNVVGFDDGYDTTGELLARSLRDDPLGTGRSIATGAYEGAKQAVMNPRETLAALGDEFVSAFDLLSTPAPEDASREELGTRLEALSLLSSVFPAGKAVGAAGDAINVGVDTLQRNQAARFMDSLEPAIPAPYIPPGSRMIVPTADELSSMSPDMLEGAFDIPLVNRVGDVLGGRLVTPLGDEAVEHIRPRSLDNVTIIDDPNLPKGVYGQAGDNEIRLRAGLSPTDRAGTLRHEVSHIDARGSNLPGPETGASVRRAEDDRSLLLEDIKTELQKNKNLTADERRRYKELQAEIRSLTPKELYERNPGEMLARLAQGSATTIRRLSATELLNPHIVNQPLSARAKKALQTGVLSRTSRLRDLAPEKYKEKFSKDFYTKAPMDLAQARVMGFNYDPVNNEPGFIPGGVNVAPGGARQPAIPGSVPYSASSKEGDTSGTKKFKDGGLVDHYLGPTGIPDRLRALGELDPIQGVMRAMSASGRAADSDLPSADRVSAAKEAAMETGIALLPVGIGRLAGSAARGARPATPNAAKPAEAVVETLTGVTPDLESPGRRKFLAGMGAAAVAPMLPAEELLTKVSARGASKSALGPLLAKLKDNELSRKALDSQLLDLSKVISRGSRGEFPLPDILMTPEKAEMFRAADEAAEQRKPIVEQYRSMDPFYNGLLDDVTDALLEDANRLGELPEKGAFTLQRDVFDTLAKRSADRLGLSGRLDTQNDLIEAAEAGDIDGLLELGLKSPEAGLAITLRSSINDYVRANYKDGGLIQTPAGTRRGTVLPATFPEGMSGGEALMSGQAELALPGMIVDPINSIAEAFMTVDRLRRGENLPKEQVEAAGMTLATAPMSPAALAKPRPNTLFANPPSGDRKVQGRFSAESTLSKKATENLRAPEAGSMTGATKRQTEDLASRKAAPGTGEGRRAETADMSTLRLVRTPVETARTKVQGAAPQSGQSARYDPVSGEATASFQRKPGDVYRMAAEAVSGDPSNEWLEVPAGTLERLNMTVNNFTDPKSRVSPDKRTVYLASGPDSARFLQAWGSQAEFFGLPKAPTLTKPSVLPNRSIFGFPTVAKQGKSFEDLKQEARSATVKSQGPAPKSKFFD